VVRILLADDHAVMRAGLRLILEARPDLRVIADVADGRQAVAAAETSRPDLAVLDIGMPVMNGIEAARQISALGVSVVMLSMHSDETYVLRALKAGALGYILKESAESDILAAVQAVAAGKAYFSPTVSRMLVDDHVRHLRNQEVDDSYELLTGREREVLQLIAEGKSSKEVANLLKISVYTAETHRARIMSKLNLHGLPDLILYAVRKGVIR
jgi:two-component system response regulator NreC